jgi:hypothetical protein
VGSVLSRVGRVSVFAFRLYFVWDTDYDNNGVKGQLGWMLSVSVIVSGAA